MAFASEPAVVELATKLRSSMVGYTLSEVVYAAERNIGSAIGIASGDRVQLAQFLLPCLPDLKKMIYARWAEVRAKLPEPASLEGLFVDDDGLTAAINSNREDPADDRAFELMEKLQASCVGEPALTVIGAHQWLLASTLAMLSRDQKAADDAAKNSWQNIRENVLMTWAMTR